MLSHHKLVSPQNDDPRPGRLPLFSNATAASVLLLSTHLNNRASFHILLMAEVYAAFMTSFQ